MRRFTLLLTLVCVALAASTAAGQCINGICPLPARAITPAAAYQWIPSPHAGQVDLYQAGRQVGAYMPAAKVFRFRTTTATGWSAPTSPPVALPPIQTPEPPTVTGALPTDADDDPPQAYGQAPPAVDPLPLFGVDQPKVAADREKAVYRLSGRPTSKQAAFDAVKNGLPDEKGKLRLTVIGTKEDRARFESDWLANCKSPEMKEFCESCILWSVPPDHWSLKDTETGKAMFREGVYLQAPDGEVLHHAADYRGPGDIGAIRKAKASYDERKTPDFRRPMATVSPTIWILAAGAIAFYLLRRPAAAA